VVGAPSREDTVTIPASSLLTEKVIKGSVYGSARPRVDMPRLVDLYMSKKIKIDELVTRTYPLDEVNEAMTALEKGEVARSVIVM
jgi:Zn-dependent alcohol dehydrogenase